PDHLREILDGVYDATEDPDFQFRMISLRSIWTYRSPEWQPKGVEAHLVKWAMDSSPAVRRDWLIRAAKFPAETAKDVIRELAKKYDGKDRFYLAAIGIAVGHPGISKEIDERR